MLSFEDKWENSQILGWKNNKDFIVSLFKRFNLDVIDLYAKVISCSYDRMQAICYLLSKIGKVIKICDFLDTLEKENHEDVEVIKIYLLISHAEIASRTFGVVGKKDVLVKEFFDPIVDKYKLNYKIRLSLGKLPRDPKDDLLATDILYKIRCEYAHEGNYTGRIFRKAETESMVYNGFSFKHSNSQIMAECSLSYTDFLNIFMDALWRNIEKFIEKKNWTLSNIAPTIR